MNVNILGISELKWTGMGEFNSDDHYIYYCQESLRRNGVAMMVNKRVQNAVLGCNLKNDRMISVRFQGKPFIITVIKVYAPTTNAEEAEVDWFYENLQDLLAKAKAKSLSRVQFFATPWTVAYQSPPPTEFSRQEYWRGLPFPSPVRLHRTDQFQLLQHYWLGHRLGLP